MKTLFFSIFISWVNVNSQEVVFKNFDFSKGGYYLYLIECPKKDRGLLYDPNSYIDTIHNFYTSNAEVLKSIQKEWKLKKDNVHYLCGYDFNILLVRNDTIVQRMLVNLDCKQLILNGQEYKFDSKLLKKHWPAFKPIIVRQRKFETKEDGKLFWDSISRDDTYIFKEQAKPKWFIYEGRFMIYPGNNESPSKAFRTKLEMEIKARYPEEPFELEGDSYFPLTIYCNESLYKKFSLYEKTDWYKYYDYRIDTKQIPEKESNR